jgi:predicted CopG family antitoxin
MKTESTVVKIPQPLYDKLVARKHPGQSVAGVIQEMLDRIEKEDER